MIRLRGHFDGKSIVLDDPAPADLKPDTPVEVLVPEDARQKALREFLEFMEQFWSQPLPPGFKPTGQRSWKREDLYERGGKALA
jgi:hypothetical protein